MIDGTWWQASKVLKKSPALARLARYGIVPQSPSNYRIRKEPSIECLSTIEALCEALAAIEGPAVDVRAMLAPFDAMVDFQLAYARAGVGYGRHKKKPKKDRRREVPEQLARTPTGVVVGYAESNAWPFERADRPAPELVHWVAERLDDGAKREWIIAPEARLRRTPRASPSSTKPRCAQLINGVQEVERVDEARPDHRGGRDHQGADRGVPRASVGPAVP